MTGPVTVPADAMTEQNLPFLPMVRRLEAVGFRAWPATSVLYDGSWQLRLTQGHPSKRLNCMVPLDPSDLKDIAVRLEKTGQVFRQAGTEMTIRHSPLCPPDLADYLGSHGWSSFEETTVMTARLDALDLGDGMDHLPTHDIERFTDACLAVEQGHAPSRTAMLRVLGAIDPTAGMFLIEDEATGPTAVTLCVHDGDLAGLLQVAVTETRRGLGIGREIVTSALRWARLRSAQRAWLQVLSDNGAALALYRSLGFEEAYRYRYWRRNPMR